jgi:hypothetical protein
MHFFSAEEREHLASKRVDVSGVFGSADKAGSHPANDTASRSATIDRSAAFAGRASISKGGTLIRSMISVNDLARLSTSLHKPAKVAPGAAQ